MIRNWLGPRGTLVREAGSRQWIGPTGSLTAETIPVPGIGTSAAAATVAGAGKAKAKSVGSSTGAATVTGAGKEKVRGAGSSVGASTVSGTGKAKAKGAGAATGTGAGSAVGKAKAKGVGSAAGTVVSRDTTIRVWGGHGVRKIGGYDYLPLGDRGFAQQTAGAIGGVAQGMLLTLSGVEDAALALLDRSEVQGASVVVYRLIFASDGKTLLDYRVFDRGRGDAISVEDTVGGPASINFSVESAARGLGKTGSRTRSDPDQRLLASNDGYFKNTAFAGQKMAYWGGKKPARVGAVVTPSPPNGDFSGSSS